MMTSHRWAMAFALVTVMLGGCESQQKVLVDEPALATQAALRRAQFEMSCPSATATILSSQLLQPVAWRGLERAEYTIGVNGRGKRETYVSICQLGSPSCLALSPRVNTSMQ